MRACLDTKNSLEIYDKISQPSDFFLRLSKVKCKEGSLFDVVPLHGSFSTMMQRSTKAKVTHKHKIFLLPSINKR